MRCCAALIGLALACVAQAGGARIEARDFVLPALDGGNYRLSEYRGNVVAVVFWASWSGGSREQLALMRDLQSVYRDWGMSVLAVSLDERAESAASVVNGLDLSYPVLWDRSKAVSQAWNPDRLPATYLVDRSGVLRYAQEAGDGPPETQELITRLRTLLDE